MRSVKTCIKIYTRYNMHETTKEKIWEDNHRCDNLKIIDTFIFTFPLSFICDNTTNQFYNVSSNIFHQWPYWYLMVQLQKEYININNNESFYEYYEIIKYCRDDQI